MDMYKSPIEIIQGQLKLEMENGIMRAVQEQNIVVDKHELLRALQYDRGQYEKGYMAGEANAKPTWIPVTERLPEPFCDVLIYDATFQMVVTGYITRHKEWIGVGIKNDITHWMPLPEAPKGE